MLGPVICDLRASSVLPELISGSRWARRHGLRGQGAVAHHLLNYWVSALINKADIGVI